MSPASPLVMEEDEKNKEEEETPGRLLPASPLVMAEEETQASLPSCLVPASAGQLLADRRGTVDDMAAAQSVTSLLISLILALLQQVYIFASSKFMSSCVEGRAYSPPWLLATTLPFLSARMWLEWHALKYLMFGVASFYKRERHQRMTFSMMGVTLKCEVWLAVCMVCSLLNFFDLATDSSFVARTSVALTCGHGDRLERLWHASWLQSLPGVCGIPAPDLGSVIFGFWFLTLVQLVWPLAKMLDAHLGTHVPDGYENTPFGREEVFYSAVAFDLGEASGMTAVQKLQVKHVESVLERSEFMSVVLPFGDVMTSRIMLSWLAENAVQLNLQATLFNLAKRASQELDHPAPVQYDVLLSIVIGLLASLGKLAEAWDFFSIVAKIKSRPDFQAVLNPGEEDKLHRTVLAVRIGCFVFVTTLVYAGAKMIGTFVCQDGIWNITGCVVLDD